MGPDAEAERPRVETPPPPPLSEPAPGAELRAVRQWIRRYGAPGVAHLLRTGRLGDVVRALRLAPEQARGPGDHDRQMDLARRLLSQERPPRRAARRGGWSEPGGRRGRRRG
jgi:hypothetical protein